MRKLFNFLHSVRKWYWRTFNVRTFGVRAIVIKDGDFLLVKHRYGDYWVFPGGGLKKGEDIRRACAREILEETGIGITEFERTLGKYENTSGGKNDIVTVLVAGQWEIVKKTNWSLEIKEQRFFCVDELPRETSPATMRRIKEYLSGERGEFSEKW